VGAAIVAPASLSLITASFPAGRERARAIALYGATAGIGASLGMVVGGTFTELISWRAGFFINVPIGLAMILLAPRYLPISVRQRGRFDVTGALASTLGVGSIVFAVINAAEAGWGSPFTVAALILGAVLLVGLVINESRAAQPIMPLRLFRSRVRVGGYIGRMLYMGAMIGFFYFTTQFLQTVLGLSPLQAGLGFLPMTIVNFGVAMLITRIVRRVGETVPLLVGVALTLGGMIWLSQLTPSSDYLLGVALPMIVLGAGQGLTFAPLTSAGIFGVRDEDAGAASGLVNTFHQVGMAVGLGVLVAVSAPAAVGGTSRAIQVATEVSAALTGSSVLLGLCLITCIVLILPAAIRSRSKK
jgi:MFS family permease